MASTYAKGPSTIAIIVSKMIVEMGRPVSMDAAKHIKRCLEDTDIVVKCSIPRGGSSQVCCTNSRKYGSVAVHEREQCKQTAYHISRHEGDWREDQAHDHLHDV